MPTSESTIFFPEKEVKVGRDQKVTVREMNHRKALEFLRVAAKYIGQFFDSEGKPKADLSTVVELVQGTDELSSLLIEGSTGRKPEEFPISVSLDILDAALELNLSEEILEKGKKLAGRFQAAAGFNPAATLTRPAQPSAKSTTSSASEESTKPAT